MKECNDVIKKCAWCGEKFNASFRWYRPRLPILCVKCRKNKEIRNRFKGLNMKVE